MRAWRWVEQRQGPLVWAVLAIAMAVAAGVLLWEGRGLTFFVDEWGFGFGRATAFDASSLFGPDNGHLAVVPILLTKASLELFGAGTTLPLRLVGIAAHLGTALFLFIYLRRRVGPLAALPPAVLILFFGVASDLLLGSHGLPMVIAVATGMGALLALDRGTGGWDAAAAGLLVVGIGSNGLSLPFAVAAAALVLLGPRTQWRRLWVPALPVALYAIWWLAYGHSHQGASDFSLGNLAGLPSFAFDSLAAELAAITGFFAKPGLREGNFDLAAGQALAGALLVALTGLLLVARPAAARAVRPVLPALLALLALWLFTGAEAGPGRQPDSTRYLYLGAILILMIAGNAVLALPYRRRGALVLAAICLVGLLPNVREIHYQTTFFREQSNQNRAELAAADLLPASTPGATALETGTEPGEVPDLSFSLAVYRESSARFGSPAFSRAQLEATDNGAREAADRLLGRALPVALAPAAAGPAALPAGEPASEEGGSLAGRRGCLLFRPLAVPARVRVPVPPAGLWIRPRPGPSVPVTARRFGDGFPVAAGAAIGGGAYALGVGTGAASKGWEAQIEPQQEVLICGNRAG